MELNIDVATFAAPDATSDTAFTASLTTEFTAPEDCVANIFTLKCYVKKVLPASVKVKYPSGVLKFSTSR